jgi:CheY-like chemotaxis protein
LRQGQPQQRPAASTAAGRRRNGSNAAHDAVRDAGREAGREAAREAGRVAAAVHPGHHPAPAQGGAAAEEAGGAGGAPAHAPQRATRSRGADASGSPVEQGSPADRSAAGNGSGVTRPAPASHVPRSQPVRRAAPDDRAAIHPGDFVLLLIDDDPTFTSALMDRARAQGFKVVVATGGESGLALARDLKPHAITLDISLPGMNGWAVLDRLKHDPAVRHIPVHIVSITDEGLHCTLVQGARGYINKSATDSDIDAMLADLMAFVRIDRRSLLVVEDDDNQLNSIIELLGGDDVDTASARSAEEALEAMRSRRFDCVVLDLGLPEMNGAELLDRIRDDPSLAVVPVVVYTARDLTRAEKEHLHSLAEAVILKDASSPERLLEETGLFLHRDESKLAPAKRQMLEHARRNDPALVGTRVLIVDDDVRNVFALTAALEQRFGMNVLYADNGLDGIEMLRNNPRIDVVLMDVMMPGVDGYETMRRMHQLPGNEDIPIIAVTAKAMKGDREKCLAAGASDYIAKPVDTDQLASLIRVWVSEAGRERRRCDPQGVTV